MATTINGETPAETAPYAENDKLGPLGAPVSALRDPADLRKTLLRAFASAVRDAQKAAASVDDHMHEAVHDARKALRRARSVLRMVAPALPKSERRAIEQTLQEARRSMSSTRDHAVAPVALERLVLGDEDRATASRVLENAARALPAVAEIKQLVHDAAARAATQLEVLDAALPAEVPWDVVREGIEDVYGEARGARRSAKRSTPWFHAWRRRTKELTYQLDFVAEHSGPRVAAIHGEMASISDLLGPAVDLVMLRDFVETHGQGIPSGELRHLQQAIDAQLADLVKEGRRAARDTFRQKPKKFGKRLTKAVRRDLTPADDADSDGEIAGG